MKDEFPIKNRIEAEKFDLLINEYHKKRSSFDGMDYFNLALWYDFTIDNNINGARIFASVFDMKLNLVLLDLENISSIRISEPNLTNNEEEIFLLKDIESFSIFFNLFENYSNFIFRYRALWDKIMGLFVLIYSPEKYDWYRRSKSRKNAFSKYITENPINISIDFQVLLKIIEKFDNEFRTPEAHGTGALRTWVFNPLNFKNTSLEERHVQLNMDYWNPMIYVVSEIEEKILKNSG